ncbi:MAG TPA: hypothetical protein ENG03_08890 [Thioploca sp.]|nr:MAG: hypothetical protein B6247_04600 [Beggiatoa sp. 4572_84]RKZ63810.1 MAG: hypothetical protein DRR08_02510 [Gammaproteobacteria bacterium]HDN27195.1 hypothetical protein [Thioploca sp.]
MELPLQDSPIEKIFGEHFKGEVPIVKYGSEKKVFISNVKNELSTMNVLKCWLRLIITNIRKKSMRRFVALNIILKIFL